MHLKLDTKNLPVAKTHPLISWPGGHITPGKGTSDLRIGQSITDVELILGSPDEKRPLADHLFYVYKSAGIDVDFGCSRWVKRLFFYDANVEGHTRRSPVTLGGIGFHTPKTKVINMLGKPQCEGGPVRVANRKKTWIYYPSGLQFDFDSRDRVIIISVCDPKLNRSVKKC